MVTHAPALHTWANPHTHYRLHFCCPHIVYAPFLDHWGHRHLITAIIDGGNMDFPCPNNAPHHKISSCPHNIISRCNSALSHACQHTVSNVALHSVLDAISIKLSMHVGVKFVVTPYDCMSMLLRRRYIGLVYRLLCNFFKYNYSLWCYYLWLWITKVACSYIHV